MQGPLCKTNPLPQITDAIEQSHEPKYPEQGRGLASIQLPAPALHGLSLWCLGETPHPAWDASFTLCTSPFSVILCCSQCGTVVLCCTSPFSVVLCCSQCGSVLHEPVQCGTVLQLVWYCAAVSVVLCCTSPCSVVLCYNNAVHNGPPLAFVPHWQAGSSSGSSSTTTTTTTIITTRTTNSSGRPESWSRL